MTKETAGETTKEIKKLGILGGGQLGRMLTQASIPLGLEVTVLNPTPNSPAAQVGAQEIVAELDDTDAILELTHRTDVLTIEIEHVPADYLDHLQAEGNDVQPNPNTLAIIQDKLTQKKFLHGIKIPVAPFSDALDESALMGTGPYIVKARKGGYDGRGNLVVNSLDDPAIVTQFGDQPVYVEQVLNFEKELSVVAARDMNGAIKIYPVVETIHENNICHTVLSPADISREVELKAISIARETLSHLEGAGVFAVEMFLVNDEVLVNEIAPRVHNSGHHTIEASQTSQFEQHVRAVTGLPLGETAQEAPAAAMVNILGTKTSDTLDRTGLRRALELPNTYVHFYGKTPRLDRKIGHVTTLASNTLVAKLYAQGARDFFTEV